MFLPPSIPYSVYSVKLSLHIRWTLPRAAWQMSSGISWDSGRAPALFAAPQVLCPGLGHCPHGWVPAWGRVLSFGKLASMWHPDDGGESSCRVCSTSLYIIRCQGLLMGRSASTANHVSSGFTQLACLLALGLRSPGRQGFTEWYSLF